MGVFRKPGVIRIIMLRRSSYAQNLRAIVGSTGAVRWGDVATWIAAIGPISSVAVALLQVTRERKLRLGRELRDRSYQHRAHAELIAASVGPPQAVPHNTETPSDRTTLDSDVAYQTPIYIHSGSLEPIHEIVVALYLCRGRLPTPYRECLTCSHNRVGLVLSQPRPVRLFRLIPGVFGLGTKAGHG